MYGWRRNCRCPHPTVGGGGSGGRQAGGVGGAGYPPRSLSLASNVTTSVYSSCHHFFDHRAARHRSGRTAGGGCATSRIRGGGVDLVSRPCPTTAPGKIACGMCGGHHRRRHRSSRQHRWWQGPAMTAARRDSPSWRQQLQRHHRLAKQCWRQEKQGRPFRPAPAPLAPPPPTCGTATTRHGFCCAVPCKAKIRGAACPAPPPPPPHS